MVSGLRFWLVCIMIPLCPGWASSQEPADAAKPPVAKTVEQLTESVRKSIAIITITGRDGRFQGLGTGFVVSSDGLIATNLHVIAESRPITVELANGQKHPVTEVHAYDRTLDLAIIKIDTKNLSALQLGDSDRIKDGQAVVAIGNPQGLARSVVAGVVSARREIEGRQMIQLAIPLERGNSGGPLLDMQGQVLGVLTMKSLVTQNLGFAMPINTLKPLLRKPNPVPMSTWLTLGTLDPQEWSVLSGARWRRRAGRIVVDGAGTGFGGRSLCLSRQEAPQVPYEVAVAVRLDDESGAAGLAFCADGKDRHYGFYPSGGKLRLTRFDGPDVFSWKVLRDISVPQYHEGAWNLLKVRVEKDQLVCFVNGQKVMEVADDTYRAGSAGLAKFRETEAEFRGFQWGQQAGPQPPNRELLQAIGELSRIEGNLATPPRQAVERLAAHGPQGPVALRARADELVRQAAQLRLAAQAVHQKIIQDELVKVLSEKEESIDLVRGALLLSRLDNEDLDVESYLRSFQRMAVELSARVPRDADETARREALNAYLFKDRGFHGSRVDYYNRANSYLNEVLDDREGLPITLSLVYLELGRRLGLRLEGVGLPAHFVVRHVPKKGEPVLIDVFEGGKVMTVEEATKKVVELTGAAPHQENFAAVSKRAILARMVQNLLTSAKQQRDAEGIVRYLDALLAITPEAAEERWIRAILRFRAGDRSGAREDADWLLNNQPAGIDLDRVKELRDAADRPER